MTEKEKKKLISILLPYVGVCPDLLKFAGNNFLFSGARIEGCTDVNKVYCVSNWKTWDSKRQGYLSFCDYLTKVRVDSLDVFEYIRKYQDTWGPDTLVIVDPPYLNSRQSAYGDRYFGLKETIALLNCMRMREKGSYIFFNQKGDDIEALLSLLGFVYTRCDSPRSAASGSMRSEAMFYITLNKNG